MSTNESSPPVQADYSSYFKAWAVLLLLTLLMVFLHNRAFLLFGIGLKGGIIGWVFMHLRSERKDFVFYIVGSIVVFSAVLFGLIAPDGLAM